MAVTTVPPNTPAPPASANSEVGQVRLEIGDTDTADQLFTDADIQSFIDRRQIVTDAGNVTNIPAAAADAASALAARFSRQFDFGEDGQSFSLSQKASQFTVLSQQLRTRAGGTCT